MVDRRRNVRYLGHKKVIVIQPCGMHHIRDISLGGLSFYCPREVILGGQWPVEIMVAGSLLQVIRVPVRLVREQFGQGSNSDWPQSKEVGVEYLSLDPVNRPFLARLLSYLQQTAKCPSCR